MARVRRSRASTTEGRFLASRIQDAHRRGFTNAEIARAYGINERTVRKIRSGETSGRRTFGRLVEPSQRATGSPNPSIVRVDVRLSNGEVRTVNARIPTLRTRTGQRVAATPADVFRIPKLSTLIEAEVQRLERQYGRRTRDEDDERAYCMRSYCGHEDERHELDPRTEMIGACEVCRCPQFDTGARVMSFRPIVARRKRLRIEISGYTAV